VGVLRPIVQAFVLAMNATCSSERTFAAVVVGGASLAGGNGNPVKRDVAAVLLQRLNNAQRHLVISRFVWASELMQTCHNYTAFTIDVISVSRLG